MNKLSHSDFKLLRQTNNNFQTQDFIFRYCVSDRFGFAISISRKCGCAVVRNRIKRRIRHAIRSITSDKQGIMFLIMCKILIICKKECLKASLPQIQEQIQALLAKMSQLT